MSLALSTLIYEWRRYMAAIIALAVAGMLVLSMVGLFAGIAKAFNAPIVRSNADLMILNSKSTDVFNGGAGLPRRLMGQIYLHPDVIEVIDREGSGGLWINDPNAGGQNGAGTGAAKAVRTFVPVFVVDTTEGAPTMPTDFGPVVRTALEQPYGIAIDRTAQKVLGVKLGDKASLNGQTVHVAALLDGYANVTNQMVFMSRSTARLLGMVNTGPRVGPLMVRVKDPAQATRVRDELNAHADGQYRAWTLAELAAANEQSLLGENIIGIMLIGGVFIGLIVGVSITWMTLQGAILANIKEFASFRALGVSMGSLRWIVMELSFWVGVAGLLATWFLTWLITQAANSVNLPMSYPVGAIVVVVVMLMVIAVLSGFFSLGVLKKSQPADLLR
jgi:putative ABC transport system permease protein